MRMPTNLRLKRATFSYSHPLPGREGILSPGLARPAAGWVHLLDRLNPPQPLPEREGIRCCRFLFDSNVSRRGEAGGTYLWMENCHPSACFTRRPVMKLSRHAIRQNDHYHMFAGRVYLLDR